MKDLSVTLSGVKLDNPIIPASGTYGFGQEFLPYYDINILVPCPSRARPPRAASATPRPASRSAPTAC